MHNVTNVFSQRLRILRGDKNQLEVAQKVGISRASLSYYESGERKPDINVLYTLADYYKVSADYLLGISDVTTTDLKVKNITDTLGLSEKSVNYLTNTNKSKKTVPEDNFDTEPAQCEVIMRTINYLLETATDENNSLLDEIATYLFATFTHYYDDNTVSHEYLYYHSTELGLWDAKLGLPLRFDKELFSKATLLNIQELLSSARKIFQTIPLERITPLPDKEDKDFDDDFLE